MIYFLARLFSSVGLISLIFEKGKVSLKTRNFLQIFLMTFFYNAATVCYFIAVSHIPLINASLLFNTAPLYIPLVASWTIGERISHKIWFGIGIIFVGVMFILKPGMELFNPYSLFAVLSCIFMACCQILNRRLTAKEPASLLVTYLVLFSIFFSFLTVIFSDWKGDISRWMAQSDPWMWIGVLVLSGLASWTFQILRTHAVRMAKVGLVMPFSYFGVIFVAISGWIFFKTGSRSLFDYRSMRCDRWLYLYSSLSKNLEARYKVERDVERMPVRS